MVTFHTPFSSFAVKDVAAARTFYADVLGLPVTSLDMADGMLQIDLGDDHFVLVYPKGDAHVPASFTVLNLRVDDLPAAVHELTRRGVVFERYDEIDQDADGIVNDDEGPEIAWFTDPSGNVLAILSA